jgi:hypothetical protein
MLLLVLEIKRRIQRLRSALLLEQEQKAVVEVIPEM